MSVLVVGISHNTAPVALLEQVAAPAGLADKLQTQAAAGPHVSEAVVLATCNRVEVYAEVERFHGAVEELSGLLAGHAGLPLDELAPHLYVRYADGAVSHLFSVACGLDSMVVGESQILGQVKEALRGSQDAETIGSALNSLFQQALRVGKRAQAETDVGQAGRSLVTVAVDRARDVLGDLRGRHAVIVGAGSLAGLAAAVLHRDHAVRLTVANRTADRAERLAAGVGGRAIEMSRLGPALADADLVVSCTGALDTVVSAEHLRGRPGRPPAVVLDLALPHDVDPDVADLDGVELIDLATLAGRLQDSHGEDVETVRAIVAEEVAAFLASRRAAAVTPTVVALRDMAAGVVESELSRLAGRLPALEPEQRAEVEKTVRRVTDKLLHVPTTRLKELTLAGGETSYADALRELFALDPAAVDAVSRPDVPPAKPVDPGEECQR